MVAQVHMEPTLARSAGDDTPDVANYALEYEVAVGGPHVSITFKGKGLKSAVEGALYLHKALNDGGLLLGPQQQAALIAAQLAERTGMTTEVIPVKNKDRGEN